MSHTWKVRSQSCSSGGGATEGMRRRRACPTLALRRSPKVVVGLGVQGPSVLGEGPGTSEAMAQVAYASTALGHTVPEALGTGSHQWELHPTDSSFLLPPR